MTIDDRLMRLAVMESRDGIVITKAALDEDNPILFVNPAFERMTGYSLEEVINRNCRFLQGEDTEQTAIGRLRQAIHEGDDVLVTLRNYRKDGSLFWNELSLSPIHDEKGRLSHYLGIQKDVTSRVLLQQRLLERYHDLKETNEDLRELASEDALTGVYNRGYFDSQIEIYRNIARRNRDTLALFMIDIDHFKTYNDTYGHPAGDKALRKVASALGRVFKRGSDFVARYGGEEFVIISLGMQPHKARAYAENICEEVRRLRIENKNADKRVLTVSVGYVVSTPDSAKSPDALIAAADAALYEAKDGGRDRVVAAQSSRDTA